jgi:beta-lactamase regulating signal transducer with metallopeptidase domain
MLLAQSLFPQATVERLGWMLVHLLWQATAVALLLAGTLRPLRGAAANLRYVVSCLALALIVVLPVVTIQLIPVAESGPPPVIGPSPHAPSSLIPLEAADEMPAVQEFTPPELAAPTSAAPWHERVALLLRPALPHLVWGWLLGVLGLSAWHLGGWAQLQRLKRRMVREVGRRLQQKLDDLGARLAVRRTVTLLESALVEVPTVVGWLRPVILLPACALTGLSLDQLEAILAHELAHIRRYDYLVNVLQTVVEILGFYHPAVWWVSRRIRVERENCCDDAAVRLCGDPRQYAQALTCMEELRQGRGELALAATGGSLLARIARLLGHRPADDRRFVWLPGLITLLLVVGIVIPAALALAASGSDRSAPLSADFAAPTHDVQDMPQTHEPNRPPLVVMLDFYIAEAFSDARLDQDTATKVADLLARIPAADGRRTAADVPPGIEELQRPLAEVLAKFAPKPGQSRHLMDWLVSRGYAQVICNPRLEMFTGQQQSVATGDTPDPNAARDRSREFGSLRLNVTPNEVPDQNATRLDIDFVRTDPAYKPGEPNQETTTSTIHSTRVASNGQYTSITDHMIKRVDENGREHLLLAFVRPAIVQSPDESPSGKTDESSAPYPNGPEVGLAVEAAEEPTPIAGTEASRESRQILLNIVVAQVASDQTLDHDTAAQAKALLANATAKDEAAMPPVGEFQRPLRQIIAKYLTGRNLAGDGLRAFTDLLVAKGHAEVLTRHSILTREGRHAWVAIGKDPNRETPGASSGTDAFRVEATPTIQDDPNTILLSMGFHMENFVLFPNTDDGPIVKAKAADFRIAEAFRDNEYRAFPLAVTADTGGVGVPAANHMLLLLVKATVADELGAVSAAGPTAPSVALRTETAGEPNALEADKARVRVGVKIVKTVDSTELSRETVLKIEKTLGRRIRPEGRAGEFGPRFHLTVGDVLRDCVVQQSLPGETVDTLLPLLGDIKVLASPHVMTRDTEQCRFQIGTDEYAHHAPPAEDSSEPTKLGQLPGGFGGLADPSSEPGKSEKIEAGIEMDVTPHIGDHDEIVMVIGVEMTDVLRPAGDGNVPVVSTRSVRTTVTTRSGRYITLAGMAENDTPTHGQKAESVYILVIPTIVPAASAASGATGKQRFPNATDRVGGLPIAEIRDWGPGSPGRSRRAASYVSA